MKNESHVTENPNNPRITPPPNTHPHHLIKFLGAHRPEGERVEFHGTPDAPRYLEPNEVGTPDAPRYLDQNQVGTPDARKSSWYHLDPNQVGTSNDAALYLDPIPVGASNDAYVVYDSLDDDYVEFD